MSVINTNTLSLVTQNNLTKSQGALNSAIERLSSGMRINSAKDDAAGQAVANRFTASIKGLTQASRNANDGISLAQTTAGALNEVNTNLQRIRELTVQSANGSNSVADKASMQAEITQRMAEIDRTSAQTDFNGVKVLSSSAMDLSVQVGAYDGETIKIGLTEISSKTLGLTGFNVDGGGTTNTKATTTNLLVAGYAAGAASAGATPYTKTFTAADGAKANDVLAKMQNGGTVAITSGPTYTYSAATKSYTATEAARTGTNTLTAITPASGTTAAATIKLGANSMNVKIDSNGAITSGADGSALYLDASNNLTATSGSGTEIAATLTNLLSNVKGMKTAGDSITFTATGASYTSVVPAAAGAGTFAVANEQASAGTVSAQINLTGGIVDIDGGGGVGGYTIAAGGAATGFSVGVSGLTAAATEVISVDANGVATAPNGSLVYADSAKVGGVTTNAVSNATATVDPLKALDAALSTVDKLRGSLGAVQNRFDSVIANLGTAIVNQSASRSRIEDADYATEVSNMTRAQILQQAGTSVLAKANQSTEGVMSLLR